MLRLAPLIMLTACAELPPVPISAASADPNAAAPQILPLDPLLARGTPTGRAQAVATTLRGEADDLRARAVPTPVTGDLAARGAELRARADRLRAAPI